MNTTELIDALRIKGSFPNSDDLFSDDALLKLFNFQMDTDIVPLMMSLSEDYFLLTKDYSISENGSYRLPTRAIGAKLRDLQISDTGGNLIPLQRLFEEDRPYNKAGYYIVRNSIELSDGFTTGTLKAKIFSRPNKLVATTECAQVVSIDLPNKQIEVTGVPATMVSGVLIDLVQNENPCDLLSYDNAIVGVSGTTVTLTEVPEDLAVNDWICLAKQSPIPMLPEEMHPILVQSVLVACLSSKKDKALEYEMKTLEKIMQNMIRMLDPRVENNSVSFRSGRLLNMLATRW